MLSRSSNENAISYKYKKSGDEFHRRTFCIYT